MSLIHCWLGSLSFTACQFLCSWSSGELELLPWWTHDIWHPARGGGAPEAIMLITRCPEEEMHPFKTLYLTNSGYLNNICIWWIMGQDGDGDCPRFTVRIYNFVTTARRMPLKYWVKTIRRWFKILNMEIFEERLEENDHIIKRKTILAANSISLWC